MKITPNAYAKCAFQKYYVMGYNNIASTWMFVILCIRNISR